jgi:hypothetical protein
LDLTESLRDCRINERQSFVIEDGEMVLQNCDSVYGTTVLVQKPIALAMDMEVTVQCGNTVLIFSMERTQRKCFRCFRSNTRPSNPISDFEYAEELKLMADNEPSPICKT